jgi:hypothetical protein
MTEQAVEDGLDDDAERAGGLLASALDGSAEHGGQEAARKLPHR